MCTHIIHNQMETEELYIYFNVHDGYNCISFHNLYIMVIVDMGLNVSEIYF